MILATILLLALTRAEIIERMRAPVIRHAEGLVQVFANCPEDMRREYQHSIARFASDTVRTLYRGNSMKPVSFPKAGIIIHVGDIRTNNPEIITRVFTNDSRIVSRIWVAAPAYADLYRFQLEVIKGFYRSVKGTNITDEAAIGAYRAADPQLRIEDLRASLERWLAGGANENGKDDEYYLSLMRKVLEPGHASVRDILIYASRLRLYPSAHDAPFANSFSSLSFREAVKHAKIDVRIRVAAYLKGSSVLAYGGGRGESMTQASRAYWLFLMELARGKKTEDEMLRLLDDADVKLNVAMEEARKREGARK